MKTVVCLFVLVAVLAVVSSETYTSRFDNINLDEVLGSDRLLTAYYKCLLDIGRCTPEGRELKSHLKEALETRCAKCTDAQRKGTRRIIGYLINNKPQYWRDLTAKYDPEGKFTKNYENELRTVTA